MIVDVREQNDIIDRVSRPERGQDDVDSIWTSLASAMAKEDKTLPYLAVKITSVNDIDDGSLQPTRDHMIRSSP